MLMSLKAVFC